MSKSERILLSHITVRGPDLESIHQVVKDRKSASFDFLANLFAMPEAGGSGVQVHQLRECLNFLETVGIIKANKSTKGEEFVLEPNLPDVAFPLILLNRLKLSAENSFYLVHKHLVSNDVLSVDMGALKRTVESSLELGFTWNEQKLGFWMNLADYLGLGKKYAYSQIFVCFPSSELLKNLLTVTVSKRKSGERVNLGEFVNYLSTEFFECLTREGLLFKGLQQSLLVLQRKGRISLVPAASDDPNPTFVDGKRIGFVSLKGG